VLVEGAEVASLDTARPRLDLSELRSMLRLDRAGQPVCLDAGSVLRAIEALRWTGDQDAVAEIVDHGFLRDSEARYAEHIAPYMRRLSGGAFEVGSHTRHREHFCGESPAHRVELSPYLVSELPVTNDLYALLDGRRADVAPSQRRLPVTGTTWFDAALFSLWVGCRLLTEAEWERACGAAAPWPWCCEDERLLGRHAWYSENARDVLHEVGTRAPNALGLLDLHGNVWEWCADVYDPDWYRRSPARDPICSSPSGADRVCRGGSIFSLAEMCRTRFRLHEPPSFHACDLGFRLGRSVGVGREARP
jgi:formylglycine-generating enzyme required for sulfatase activity